MPDAVEQKEQALADAVRQALEKGDRQTAQRLLDELCRGRTEESQPLLRLIISFINPPKRLDRLGACEPILFGAMTQPVCNVAVADCWIRCVIVRRGEEGPLRREIDHMLQTDPLRGRRAADGLVWNLYYTCCQDQIWSYVKKRRSIFWPDHELWASIGKALSASQQHVLAVKWLKGWEKRGDVEPEDLSFLAGSLRRLGKVNKAQDVSNAALQLPVEKARHQHHMWLALDALNAGELDAVRHHMAATEGLCTDRYEYATAQRRAIEIYLRALSAPHARDALLAELDRLEKHFTEGHVLDCSVTRKLYQDVRRSLQHGR